MKKFISKSILLIILILLFLYLTINNYVSAISNDLHENIFRLHIIANSNSEEDQNLKLKIRDSILEYIKEISINCNSKQDIINTINIHLEDIKNIANNTIKENGFDYAIELEIDEYLFPTKHYANISLPAGKYDSLKIKIGNAIGENWWCSLFPPLCFTDISSGIIDEDTQNNLEKNLENEEFNIIINPSPTYKFKFKLIEILNLKNIL